MPFQLRELVPMTQILRDVCLGVIELAHPDTKPALKSAYTTALHSVGVPQRTYTEEELYKQRETWAYLFKVRKQVLFLA
jgi:ubiquitin-protein ligase E3 C